jgi:hypothetical protein
VSVLLGTSGGTFSGPTHAGNYNGLDPVEQYHQPDNTGVFRRV